MLAGPVVTKNPPPSARATSPHHRSVARRNKVPGRPQLHTGNCISQVYDVAASRPASRPGNSPWSNSYMLRREKMPLTGKTAQARQNAHGVVCVLPLRDYNHRIADFDVEPPASAVPSTMQ